MKRTGGGREFTSVTLYVFFQEEKIKNVSLGEISITLYRSKRFDSITIRINATMRAAWRRNLNEFALYFQGSADSNYSQPSSDLSLDEEKESLRREKERQALNQLEKARVSHWSFACSSFTSLSLSLSIPHFLLSSLSTPEFVFPQAFRKSFRIDRTTFHRHRLSCSFSLSPRNEKRVNE